MLIVTVRYSVFNVKVGWNLDGTNLFVTGKKTENISNLLGSNSESF